MKDRFFFTKHDTLTINDFVPCDKAAIQGICIQYAIFMEEMWILKLDSVFV